MEQEEYEYYQEMERARYYDYLASAQQAYYEELYEMEMSLLTYEIY